MPDPPRIVLSSSTYDAGATSQSQNLRSPPDSPISVSSQARSRSRSRSNSFIGPSPIINNRLSIFTNNSNSSQQDHQDFDNHSINSDDSHSTGENDHNSSFDGSSRRSIQPDQSSLNILDTALNGAWMPTNESPKKLNTNTFSPIKPLNSNNSNLQNDIELNLKEVHHKNNIPMQTLNIPTIHVSNYLESNSEITSPNPSQPSSRSFNPNDNILKPPNNQSAESVLRSRSSSNSSSPSYKSKISHMFVKISDIINSDSPLANAKVYDDNPDIDQIQDDQASYVNQDEHYPNKLTSPSHRLDYNHEDDEDASMFNYYLDEIDHQEANDDIVSILSSKPSTHHHKNPFLGEGEVENEEEDVTERTYIPSVPTHSTNLFGNSLKYFSPESKIRILASNIITNPITNIISFSLIITQVGLLSYQQWKPENGYFFHNGNSWVDWVLAVFYFFYTLEMIGKIIAFGLYDDSQMIQALKIQRYENKLQLFYKKTFQKFRNTKLYRRLKTPLNKISRSQNSNLPISTNPQDNNLVPKYKLRYAYLRTDWNKVDFVSIISFWVVLFVSLNVERMRHIQIFRSLMCLRILRLLNLTKGSRIILRGLKDATMQSKDVISFLLFFWIIFAIVGVEAFKSSFRRQCLWTNPSDPSDTWLNSMQFCGSYLDPITLQPQPFLDRYNQSSGIIKGFTCPANSVCAVGENPYNGKVSFDNIVMSMQSVFVIISGNTFADLMYYTMDSDSMAAALFFVISMFILVVWLVNLFVAVIIHSYRTEEESKIMNIGWFERRRQSYGEFTANSKFIQKYKRFDFIPVSIIFFGFVYSCTKAARIGKVSKSYNLCEFIVSIVLLVEIFIRFGVFIHAGNWRAFFFNKLNLIDLSLGVLALVFSLPPVFDSISPIAYGWLSVFSILRFYRVILYVKPIRQAWGLAFRRGKPFVELILFAIILFYLSSVIISRLFEDVIAVGEYDITLWTLNTLPNTIVTLFIITSTENWTSSLYAVQNSAISYFNSFCYSVVLIMWFMMANTVLLSIFIAIITSSLELPEAEKKINQIKQFVKLCVARTRNHPEEALFDIVKGENDRKAASDEANEFIQRMNEILIANGNEPIDVNEYKDQGEDSMFKIKMKLIKKKIIEVTYLGDLGIYLKQKKQDFKELYHDINPLYEPDDTIAYSPDGSEHAQLLSDGTMHSKPSKKVKVDRSLYVFTNENAIRRFCQMFVFPFGMPRVEGKSPNVRLTYAFNAFLFISSVVVVVLACYDTPLYRNLTLSQPNNDWMIYPDIVFMVIFTIEFIIKIIADGFILGVRAYAKSAWNMIDFVVLISFWVTSMSVINTNYNAVVTFSALRALRAFRLLTITRESKEVFQIAVLSGAGKVLSAALVSMSLLIPFALWGLNIFSNEFSSCTDGVSTIFNCSLEYTNTVFNWDVYSPNVVQTPDLHFDDFSSAVQTLFEILSLEGWVDLLDQAVSIVGYGEPTSAFASSGNGVFVIIFIFVSSILIINLFIAIIINNYSVQTGVAYLNNEQYGWYEVKKVLSKVQPSKRRRESEISPLKRKVYKFITKPDGVWQWFYRSMLAIHFLILLSESYPNSPSDTTIRIVVQSVNTFGICLHFVLSPIAFGFRKFYSNIFNAVMCAVAFAAFILSLISIRFDEQSVFFDIYKMFLVTELILIIPQIDSLTQLFKYGSTSLFSLATILYTWLVLFLVFAIALNQVFGLTRLGSNTTGNLNARTVTKALIMLFRNSFGEGWNEIMVDFEISEPYCYAGGYGNNDCGNEEVAKFLFIVWNILSMYIFCNILISVVINNFSYVYHGSGPHKLITRDEIRRFKQIWNMYDISGSGYIYEDDLYKFLHSLDGVLSYHVYPKYISIPAIQKRVLHDVNITSGYDFQLNLTKLAETLSLIDFSGIRKRRFRYTRLIFEILAAAKSVRLDNTNGKSSTVVRKIPFSNTLLCIGYYSRFEDSTCLNLEDFLRHSSQIRDIDRKIRKEKFLSTIKMVYTRLKYRHAVVNDDIFTKIKNAPTEQEKERLRKNLRASLTGKNIDFELLTDKLDDIGENGSVFDQNLFRVTSAESWNPFSDVYATNNEEGPSADITSTMGSTDEVDTTEEGSRRRR